MSAVHPRKKTLSGGAEMSASAIRVIGTAANSDLFDQLVGAEQERLQNRQAEHLGGLEVD